MNFKSTLLLCLPLTFAPLYSAHGHTLDIGGNPNLVIAGNLISSTNGADKGIYNFKASSGNLTVNEVAKGYYMDGNAGSVATNSNLYIINYTDYGDGEGYGRITGFGMEDWNITYTGQLMDTPNMVASALTYDASNDIIYGCFSNSNSNGYEFGTLDVSSRYPKRTKILPLSGKYVAMADNDNGTLYAIDATGTLYTLNESTGAATKIGDTGVTPSSLMQAAVYEPSSGKIYWAAQLNSSSSALYTVDPATATVEKIGDFPNGEEFSSLFISKPLAADGAPAAITSLTPDFKDGSTTGTVSFTLPSTTFNGNELKGDVDWYLLVAGDTIAQGHGTAGSEVTTPNITVPNDYVQFVELTRNSEGFSPKYKQTAFVGPDTPSAVPDAKVNVDSSNKATISWQASQGSINDGYFIQDSVTYTVVRYPDEVTIASGIRDTSVVDQLPKTSGVVSYYWRVTPVFMGNEGSYAETDQVKVGSGYEVPYLESFDEGWPDHFTVLDLNDDYLYWYDDYSGHAYSQAGGENGNDDWMITPDIHFAPGLYKIAFRYWGGLPGYADYAGNAFEVGFGQGTDPSTFKIVGKASNIILDESQQKEFSATVKVTEDGKYNVGIHDVSPSNAYLLYIDSLSVTQGGTLEVPDTVGSLRAVADADGALRVSLSFTAPSKNADGEALSSLSHIYIVRDDSTIVKTFDAPQPGAELSFDDTDATGLTDGQHTYTLYGDNDKGKGLESSVSVIVGIEAPGDPSDVAIKEEGNHIHVTWKAPQQSAAGHPLNVQSVKYNIYAMKYFTQELFTVAQNVEGTSYDDSTTFDLNGQQYQIYYIIEAANRAGTSNQMMSNQTIIGAPDSLPYHESFSPEQPNQMEHLWWIDLTQDINTMSFFRFITGESSDGDDGCASYVGGMDGCFGNLRTGKINMSKAKSPALTFDYECNSGEDALLTVQASSDLENWTDVYTIDYDSITVDNTWRQAKVDLSSLTPYNYVYLRFHAESNNTDSPVTIDNVNIKDSSVTDGIGKVNMFSTKSANIYSIDGKLIRKNASSLNGLKPGLYIMNGHKVMVR